MPGFNERGGFGEGFGTDLEVEAAGDQAEMTAELSEFENSWKTPENSDQIDSLMKKWKTNKDSEQVLNEIRDLDRELSEALDDEDINMIIAERVGGPEAAAAEEEADQGYEEAA